MTDYTLRAPRSGRQQAELTIRKIREMHRNDGGTSRLVRRTDGLYVLTLRGADGGRAREAASALAKLTSIRGSLAKMTELFARMAPA